MTTDRSKNEDFTSLIEVTNVRMVVNAIKVYARIKKENKPNEKWLYTSKRNGEYEDIVFHSSLGVEHGGGQKFRFHQIFDEYQRQDEIFDTVAKPVVLSVLQGFNGTIFAYGQTGSGKTYTMTGSTKHYANRGIIPRSLQYIFSAIEKTEEKPTLYISYMEIYNEICYDLLSPRDSKTAVRLEELPRVTLLENKKGEACLRNLSVLPVSTEEEAMRLLFLGDTNRAIAETPLNEYSSRSHCIFTVYVSTRLCGSESMTFSKLNLVDLAGSERVHKSNITGTVLNEAKHINLSLHFLQQVILALSESKRSHIPYRNSLMTLILKDSLAGSCLTVMLATLAVSRRNIQETISTCRFAQRVSLIKTDPVINEVSDPYQEILLLKNEVQELRKQLANREHSSLTDNPKCLTSKQKEDLERKLEVYLDSNEDSFRLDLAPGLLQSSFRFFKNKIKMLENKLREKENLLSTSSKAKDDDKGSSQKDLHESNNINNEETNLRQFWNETQNTPEVDFYLKRLSVTYEKAKLVSTAIEECQVNISYIRGKIEFMSKAGDRRKKLALCKELEHQQKIYRDSLMQLKDLKNETLQLEAGLTKAKAKFDHYLIEQKSCHSQSTKLPPEIQEEPQTREECIRCLEERQFLNARAPFSLSSSKLQLQTQGLNYCWDCFNSERDNCGDFHVQTYKEYGHQSSLRKQSQFETSEVTHKCCCYAKQTDYANCCRLADPTLKRTHLPDIASNSVTNYCAPKSRICSHDHLKSVSSLSSVHSSMKYIGNGIQENKGGFIDDTPPCYGSVATSAGLHRADVFSAIKSNAFLSGNSCENCVCTQHTKVQNSPKVFEDNLENTGNKTQSELTIVEANTSILTPVCDVQLIPDKLSKSEFHCQNKLIQPPPACQEDSFSDMSCNIDENKSKETHSTYNIFEETDTEDFKKFVSTLTLTGDEEVDKEICNFYRAKLCP